jgi:cell division protein FtsW
MTTWPPLQSLDAEGGAIALARPEVALAPSHAPEVPEAAAAGGDLGRFVIILVAILTTLGLVAIYAASSLKGAQQFGDEYLFLRKQTVNAVVGFGVIAAVWWLPFRYVERATLPFLGLVFVLLLLIFVPGMYTKVGGAPRWLNLPIVGGQPAELTKLAMVLFLARNLSRPTADIRKFAEGILPNLIVLGLFSALLLCQKDLGTPVLLGAVTVAMLFAAGVSRTFIAGSAAGAVLAVGAAVAVEPYRMARLLSFLDPWASARGSGFQIIQSFLAFQNGGLLGVGLGESKQKLFFLPEAHTDFILAVIGEELGLVGVALVCVLFFLLVRAGFRIAARQPTPHRRFLAFGLTLTIALQAGLNMGVAMGLLPTKGMPLPFISSGNSSLLVFLAISAILAKLGRGHHGDRGFLDRATGDTGSV